MKILKLPLKAVIQFLKFIYSDEKLHRFIVSLSGASVALLAFWGMFFSNFTEQVVATLNKDIAKLEQTLSQKQVAADTYFQKIKEAQINSQKKLFLDELEELKENAQTILIYDEQMRRKAEFEEEVAKLKEPNKHHLTKKEYKKKKSEYDKNVLELQKKHNTGEIWISELRRKFSRGTPPEYRSKSFTSYFRDTNTNTETVTGHELVTKFFMNKENNVLLETDQQQIDNSVRNFLDRHFKELAKPLNISLNKGSNLSDMLKASRDSISNINAVKSLLNLLQSELLQINGTHHKE